MILFSPWLIVWCSRCLILQPSVLAYSVRTLRAVRSSAASLTAISAMSPASCSPSTSSSTCQTQRFNSLISCNARVYVSAVYPDCWTSHLHQSPGNSHFCLLVVCTTAENFSHASVSDRKVITDKFQDKLFYHLQLKAMWNSVITLNLNISI